MTAFRSTREIIFAVAVIVMAPGVVGPAVAQDDQSDPARFVSSSAQYLDLPVIAVERIDRGDMLTDEPWPFVGDAVVIACAEPSMNVVGASGSFAALNGNASGFSDAYKIEDTEGELFDFVRTNDNQNYKDAGIVLPEAENRAIGLWWHALNSAMEERCG
ncbi:hypothetical protein VQ042_08030 [Aurantimonas sp. A2-1-M11]|uniref:hypothetical protein n=1 Tax=Aurantimonas sp. A2-1-M11 TaxID=3113712 RepID=UPI002F932D9C